MFGIENELDCLELAADEIHSPEAIVAEKSKAAYEASNDDHYVIIAMVAPVV